MKEIPIAVRAYTKPKEKDKKSKKGRPKKPLKLVLYGQRIMVLDTETTTDFYQNLTFGCCRVYQYSRGGKLYNRYKDNFLQFFQDGYKMTEYVADDYVLKYEVLFYGDSIKPKVRDPKSLW